VTETWGASQRCRIEPMQIWLYCLLFPGFCAAEGRTGSEHVIDLLLRRCIESLLACSLRDRHRPLKVHGRGAHCRY